jgi:hypothetical protein
VDLDTQVVELIGRNRLVNELLRDGLEVAVPARDRGVDVIAYADLSAQVATFSAKPIQMKAFSAAGFSVSAKYSRISNLLMAYVWHVNEQSPAVTYALTYADAVKVGEAMGWTETSSWKDGGIYSSTKPSERLKTLIEPFRVVPGRWWGLVVAPSS